MHPSSDRELEIKLDLHQGTTYGVELRYNDPNDDAAGRAASGKAAFDFDELEGKTFDNAQYGALLTEMLFGDEGVRQFFGECLAQAGGSLRIRLFIDASAAQLNNLRWELLRNPADNLMLTTSERVLFSRFVVSNQWRPVKLRARARLRALIAVSNPTDLARLNMAPVRKEIEIPAARKALEGIDCTVLGENEAVTLGALVAAIRKGVDIVYLVCHGSYVDEPHLFLQNKDGGLELASGDDLAQVIGSLAEPPRLMVLASCESAGKDGRFAESALAPRLAVAGVPAIVAMQAKVGMDTIGVAMPRFFAELAGHGRLELAMAAARAAAMLAGFEDAWMPALFHRLKAGRLWYTAGFGGDSEKESVSWDSVCRAVANRDLVPILGPDLAEHILGTSTEFAAELARLKNVALPAEERPDRPKIAQTIQTNAGRAELESACLELVKAKLKNALERLPDEARAAPGNDLEKIVNAMFQDPDDPIRILAELDVKVYVSGAMDSIVKLYLKKAGKTPLEIFSDWRHEATASGKRIEQAADELCADMEKSDPARPLEVVRAWRDRLLKPEDKGRLPDSVLAAADSVMERLRDQPAEPAAAVRKWRELTCNPPGETLSKPWPVETPVLYYVYGKYSYKDTAVLTQDDYFDYLIRHSSYKLMPTLVGDKLVAGSLLFLGFSLDDWTFRVLFRMILSKDGAELLKRDTYKHIGVQVDPEDYTPAEAARIKPLLVKYFGAAANIDIYWGSSADFLRELRDRRRHFQHQPAVSAPDEEPEFV